MAEPGLTAGAKRTLQWRRRWARARACARGRGGNGSGRQGTAGSELEGRGKGRKDEVKVNGPSPSPFYKAGRQSKSLLGNFSIIAKSAFSLQIKTIKRNKNLI